MQEKPYILRASAFFFDGTTEAAEVMSAEDFAEFYSGYGYGEYDSEYDENSPSYVAEPIENLVLLAIDSHTASVPAATLSWLCEKAKAARNEGKQVIAMMHHPLFPHITGADLFFNTYTIENNEAVRNALIDAGVNVILTGHFHTSDIAKDWNDDESKAVYDVNTCSLISYPCDYRLLTPSPDMTTLKVETNSIVPQGMSKEECKTWLQGRVKAMATDKINAKAGSLATVTPSLVNNIAEFTANLYILHAEGDENVSANRADLESTYISFKADFFYSFALAFGGITDASIYSILDDISNYDTEKADQTDDRTLSIDLPEVTNKMLKGDVNGDGKVDIVDVTMTISEILGQNPSGFNKKAADMNGDDKIDIVDVTIIIDVILYASV